MNLRTENWNGYKIRFIEKEPGEWWGIAADIAKALHYRHVPHMVRLLPGYQKDVRIVDTPGGPQEMTIVSELGIYAIIMRSRRKEALHFQEWVYTIIQSLRKASGLEGFQIFRLLDKEHQREAMSRLNNALSKPVSADFMKANSIADKAVSTMFGYPKMLKKHQMTPDMLRQRQPILDDVVSLMAVKEKFGLDLSVSKTVYGQKGGVGMLLVNSIQKSINQIDSLLDGWSFGRLVVDAGQAALELDKGSMFSVPVGAVLEVKNGDLWTPVSGEMLQTKTREGWPAYAGLEARIKERR